MKSSPGAVLVVVHGAPGSGKSTLAKLLGSELGSPVLDRDDFKDLIFDTLGWSDRNWSVKVGHASWELLRLCIDRLTRSGVSIIVESNFRPADRLTEQLRPLCEQVGVRPVEIYCRAPHEVLWERFSGRRQGGGRHAGHVGFEDRETFLADLQARPHGPLDLGGVLIEIDTTDSWPDANAIAGRIIEASANDR